MTNKEQREFIRTMIKNVTTTILNKSKDFPKDWDGWELRHYIKEQFDQVVWSDHRDKRSRRYKEFNNTCLINNL